MPASHAPVYVASKLTLRATSFRTTQHNFCALRLKLTSSTAEFANDAKRKLETGWGGTGVGRDLQHCAVTANVREGARVVVLEGRGDGGQVLRATSRRDAVRVKQVRQIAALLRRHLHPPHLNLNSPTLADGLACIKQSHFKHSLRYFSTLGSFPAAAPTALAAPLCSESSTFCLA